MIKQIFIFISITTSLLAIDISDQFRVRGFATIDATLSSDNIHSTLPNGEGNPLDKNKINYDSSLVGTQVEWDISDSFDFMLQAIYSKDSSLGDYKASVEWALLSYHFADDYTLRLGKLKVPIMKGNQLRYVGFARPWVRPQISPQGVSGFDLMNGVELLKNSYIEDIDLEFQLTYGKAEHHSQENQNNYIYNAAAKVSYEGDSIRFSYGQLSFDQSFSATKTNEDIILTFVSAETEVHFNDITLNAGYTKHSNNETPSDSFYYTALSYEFGDFIPFIIHSNQYVENIPLNSAPQRLAFSRPPPPPPSSSSSTGSGVRDGYMDITNNSIGVRYNLSENVAIKAQYDNKHIKEYTDSTGAKKTDSDTLTLSVDMVF